MTRQAQDPKKAVVLAFGAIGANANQVDLRKHADE